MAFVIVANLMLGTSASASTSEMLLCVVTEDFAGGWVPKTFLLKLPTSQDYSDAEIILPKVDVISYAKWSKGWFQSSNEWKLVGRVNVKDVKKIVPKAMFDFRYEVNVNKTDLSFETFMTVDASGDWRSNNLQTRGSCEKRAFPVGSAVARLSDGDVCAFATTYVELEGEYKPVWDDKYRQFGKEAESRGIDCGTGRPQNKVSRKEDGRDENTADRRAERNNDVILEINSSLGPDTLLLVSCGPSPITLTAVIFGQLPNSGEGLWRAIGGRFKSFDYKKISETTIQLKTTWVDLRTWAKGSLKGFELLVADASVTPINLQVTARQWNKILAYADRCD